MKRKEMMCKRIVIISGVKHKRIKQNATKRITIEKWWHEIEQKKGMK